MNSISIIIILTIALVALFILFKTKKHKPIKRVIVQDVTAQAMYERQSKQHTASAITKSEAEELSWKFLYDIADLVSSAFSQPDRDLLLESGNTLLRFNMKYIHVIDIDEVNQISHDIQKNKSKSKALTK